MREGTRVRVTRGQSQAKAMTTFLWECIPLVVCDEIEAIEKELWEEVQTIPVEEIREEVEEWLMEPETTMGTASTYDRIIMVY